MRGQKFLESTQNPRARWLGLDLLRILSMLAIHIHHFLWHAFYELDDPLKSHWLWAPIDAYARTLSFSGFSIVLLTSLLYGLTSRLERRRLLLLPFFLLAWASFCLLVWRETPVLLVWDVYPLLLIGFLSAEIFRKISPIFLRFSAIVGFILLWIPFWKWEIFSDLSLFWQQIVVGNCQEDLADWPMLPWIGLVWLGYGLGFELQRLHLRRFSFRLGWGEIFVFLPLLVVSLWAWGPYYRVLLGGGFACDVFRKEPYVFWAHMIWVSAFIRLSLEPRVQERLEKSKLIHSISSWGINQSFWIFYFSLYIFSFFALTGNGPYLREHPLMSFLIFVLLWLLADLSARWLPRLFRKRV